jgi:hypothetical protein
MRRLRFEQALLGAAAALSLSLGAPAMAADHRDAPTIDDYSAIDINDVYMFRNPSDCAPGPGCNLVVALSTQAVADPQFGSSYHFQENALYRLNFTTRKDAKPTAHIDFTFSAFENGPACPQGPACQTFKAVFPNNVEITGFATQGTASATHLPPQVFSLGPIKVFAGPRQDPFFFDLVGFNRTIGQATPNNASLLFTGVDAFRDKNINAIVVEFPSSMVFPRGACKIAPSPPAPPFSTPCGTWAVTYLGNLPDEASKDQGRHGDRGRHKDKDKAEGTEDLRQVDRMGNPAVNTVLIPGPLKDAFNFGEPKDDPKDFAGVILNQILTLDKKLGTCQNGNTSSAFACNPNVPLLASVAVPDILRFTSDAPDGYPNGRRPQDRTTDLLLQLIFNLSSFTDAAPTKTSCPKFPFLRPPLQPSASGIPDGLTPEGDPVFRFDYFSAPQACD